MNGRKTEDGDRSHRAASSAGRGEGRMNAMFGKRGGYPRKRVRTYISKGKVAVARSAPIRVCLPLEFFKSEMESFNARVSFSEEAKNERVNSFFE